MSLFQRRPQDSNPISYTTVGLNRTLLIVGLGNPGAEYTGTRHNVGFACLDAYVAGQDGMSGWIQKSDLKCQLATGQAGGTRILAVKPTTFMNLSGEAVLAVSNFYKVQPDKVYVVHDELDVSFGQVRLRTGGSAAGHNGVKHISQLLGEEYGRIRVGIGPKQPSQIDSADFVLQRFNADEAAQLPALTREVSAVLSELVYGAALATETRSFLL